MDLGLRGGRGLLGSQAGGRWTVLPGCPLRWHLEEPRSHSALPKAQRPGILPRKPHTRAVVFPTPHVTIVTSFFSNGPFFFGPRIELTTSQLVARRALAVPLRSIAIPLLGVGGAVFSTG